MKRVLLDIWLALALCLSSGLAADITEQPFELVVNREPETLKCTHLALRETQHFRGLTDSGYLKSKQLESGEERIQFITKEERAVWERAESLCGERGTWDFHNIVRTAAQGYETGQVVFRPLQDNVPHLEISPLITSGDSSNRVDLVFFADGCKSISLVFVLSESFNTHIRTLQPIDTSKEKDKFLGDALRLAEDISSNQTFYTVKPLLNFWAAFAPSKEVRCVTSLEITPSAFSFIIERCRCRWQA